MSDMEYIKDAGLKPNGKLTKREKTNLIIFHYPGVSGKQPTIGSMDAYHKSKGHVMIDYNLVVDEQGVIWKGRGLEYVGGHVLNGKKTRGMNARSVGICCIGDFDAHGMSGKQLTAVKQLTADLVRRYGFESVTQILTHDEAAGPGYTTCPGKYFPIDEIRAYIRDGGRDTLDPIGDSPVNEKGDPYYWQVAVNDLNYRRTAGGKILGQVHRGDVVYLDRYVKEEDWARVRLGGPKGPLVYVWRNYISE